MSDSKERFTQRVEDYVKYRPTYPLSIVQSILDGFDRPIVADLGAGTGISSHLLATCGATVYAIEPNVQMRSSIPAAQTIIAVDGSAEATTLSNASVDVVTAFQAYHWFEPMRTLEEARRMLRTHGRFAGVWNSRDRNDAFTGAYEAIVDRYDDSGGQYRGKNTQLVSDFDRWKWRNFRLYSDWHVQALDLDGLLGFARSASYLPRAGPAYDAMEKEIRRLFERWNGPVGFRWITEAYVAERPLE